jgi:hypothetical protein
MSVAIPNCGTYTVELDFGSTTNAFLLDDPVAGVLNQSVYLLEGSTDFQDVTAFVKQVSINRGRQNRFRDATGQASTATIQIEDSDYRFSLVNSGSPYWNATKDRLGFELNSGVRISRNGTYLFTGIITQYSQSIENPNRSLVTVNCSDALFALNNRKVSQNPVVAQRSDERIVAVFDNEGLFTRPGQRDLEIGVANLGTAPIDSSSSILEYLLRVNTAEQGRIFIKADGTFAFDRRLVGELQDLDAVLSDAGGTAIPYSSFEIVNN